MKVKYEKTNFYRTARKLGQPGMDAYLETKHVRVRVREP